MILTSSKASKASFNASPLSRIATSANPRQPPMPRFDSLRSPLRGCRWQSVSRWSAVTPPADGAECGFADRIEIAPQESRRRSRLGGATAVARLARHVICSPRLVPRTGRYIPRSRLVGTPLGCAGDRPSAAPSVTSRSAPFRFAHASRSHRPMRFAPGWARPRGCGGAAAP